MIGWHLCNEVAISAEDWKVMELVPPTCITFLPHRGVYPDDIKRLREKFPSCHIIMRPYFDPSRLGSKSNPNYSVIPQYFDECKVFIDAYRDAIPSAYRHLQIFNEPNMPRYAAQWEGFGITEDDMKHFNEWFLRGYDVLKAHDPSWRIGWTPLTVGNRDVWFEGDECDVPYYMHGRTAAKPNPSGEEIDYAIHNGPCYDSLMRADEYYAHAYFSVAHSYDSVWFGLRYRKYMQFVPKKMSVWITEGGQLHPELVGEEVALWVREVATTEAVQGICLWILGTRWGQFYYCNGQIKPVVYALAELQKELADRKPSPEPKPLAEEIVNRAWVELGIPRNPDAALFKYAAENDLGAPVTKEILFGDLILQGYAKGIVYVRLGDWSNVQVLRW